MYLAEDQGRFNERCALKEFIPPQNMPLMMEKSKELFQREVAILYQIQQPQIPQFRATFEQDGRLFLVQDYVEGKTYRTLLNERLTQGAAFTEAEVWQLLRQLLPVLAHIHSKGIIHRGISPDNIVLRESDGLPVLIDFGVVKELATRLQSSSPDTVIQPTTVGKLGYAPIEQIQTGKAYPSSDLYALGVTAVVLLTGKEPQELFNDIQLSWDWRKWVNVSDRFAQVLDRMLSYKPSDRYQSVAEVLQALIATQATVPQQTNPVPNPQPPVSNPQPPVLNLQPPVPNNTQPRDPNISQVPTIAIGHRPEPVNRTAKNSNRPEPVIPQPASRSLWGDPWPVIVFGLALALLAGFGSWIVVSAILNSRQETSVVPTPSESITPATPTPTPTPSETPSPTPTPTSFSQRLEDVSPGRTISKQGNLTAQSTVNYLFRGEQGQQLDTLLTSEGVLMTVLGPDQNPLDNRAKRVLGWRGTLPYTGDYTIQLSPIRGLAQSDYRLDVSLSNPAPASPSPSPTPTPTSTPTPTPTPTTTPPTTEFDVEPLDFPADEPAVRVSTRTSPQQIKRYLVNIQQGQRLRVEVIQGKVTLNIRDPGDQLVEQGSGVLSWNGSVAREGQYKIDVVASERTDFTLDVNLTK